MTDNGNKEYYDRRVGGQGTLLTSRVLGGLAIAGGYDVKLSEVHGMAQRGGSVVTFVRYGENVAELSWKRARQMSSLPSNAWKLYGMHIS